MDACICIDVDEYCQTISQKIVKARKEHKCMECGDTIKKGDKYEYYFGKDNGTIFIHKTCQICFNIREDLFKCGYYFGMLWENIEEHFGSDENDEYDISWLRG